MVSVKARFDGKVFIPEAPVELPLGQEGELFFAPSLSKTEPKLTLAELAELAQTFPDNPAWPPDGAAQVDHYLYGLPKRP